MIIFIAFTFHNKLEEHILIFTFYHLLLELKKTDNLSNKKPKNFQATKVI